MTTKPIDRVKLKAVCLKLLRDGGINKEYLAENYPYVNDSQTHAFHALGMCAIAEKASIHQSLTGLIESWLRGLPSAVNTPFESYEICKLGFEYDLLSKGDSDDRYMLFINCYWAVLAQTIESQYLMAVERLAENKPTTIDSERVKRFVIEQLAKADDYIRFELWNHYQDETGRRQIFEVNDAELNERFDSISDIFLRAKGTDLMSAPFFTFDDNGWVKTFHSSRGYDCPYRADELAAWLVGGQTRVNLADWFDNVPTSK